ncbi:hypothetical protein GF343_03750 [Candidatus Woesearchaeota archaeon]|nr:hypothetical protein [Candidatus Woesearchaeota archaeon]
MTLTDTENRTNSLDTRVLCAQNQKLQQEVTLLRRKTRALEAEKLVRAAESASDFTAGQMDRVVHNVRNVNYGMDKLESSIDSIRRYDTLREKTQGIPVDLHREAVSVIYLGMDHYARKKERISETVALVGLMELTGRINKYFDMRCRPADCFAKGGWQEHKFMFVLPATDRQGAKTFLNRVMRNALAGHDKDVSISYGVANYAADVKEIHAREPSRAIASRLLDAAKGIAKDLTSEFAGRIEKSA